MRQITRAAALGAVASLAAGCSTAVSRRHPGSGCIDGPEPTLRHETGPVIEGIIPVLGRSRAAVRYALAIPRGAQPRDVERVAYALPGRDGTAHDLITALGFGAAMQEIVRAGGAPFAVLAMDSGASYYHPRKSGEDRLAILERELPSVARDLLAPQLAHETLVGLGMGGYGALLAAGRNPHRYRAVAVAGPSLYQSFAEADRALAGGFDDAAQFAAYDVIGHAARLATLPVMLRVGSDDPFAANVDAFARQLPHADVRSVEHGCHDDGFWRLSARELLAFASAR